MADFASFTHKWRAIPNNSVDANKVTKRNRQPVSCQSCRVRKLKCDRGHPCEACVKRGDDDVCYYGKSTGPSATQHHVLSSSTKSNGNSHGDGEGHGRAQDRLRHLEDLVRRMIDPQAQDEASTVPEDQNENSSANDGPLNRETHGIYYKGSTHWSAILDSIHDLRATLSVPTSPESHRDSTTSPYDFHRVDSHTQEEDARHSEMALFASRPPLPLPQLLAKYLPPRQAIDRLLSIYFNSKYVPIPFIHTQQFTREYEYFWEDPSGASTSPMWLSILFSILSMADKIRMALKVEFTIGINSDALHRSAMGSHETTDSNTSDRDSSSPPDATNGTTSVNHHTSVGFLAASAQLLILGNYTRPQPYLIEALCIHNQSKYSLSLDPSHETGLILSVLVRQAYSMSYHRDCSNFPEGQFTVFEAEMRRRTWAAIKQFDLMSSFQYGIPMNIGEASWDTKPPRNLMDTDFDEDTKVLPEPRGDGEPTQMLYFVIKTKLMDVYAKILRHTLSFPQADGGNAHENTKATVMDLDAEMRRVSESVPIVMKVRPMSLSFSDPSWLIMLRTNLMFVVQKSLCVLHRKYMASGVNGVHGDPTYSRKVVIEASSNMVRHFLDIHNEFQPGGQLSRDWWMLGGFTVNDFLLANMLLCFAFWMKRKKNAGRSPNVTHIEIQKWLDRDDEAKRIYELLGQAKSVCEIYGKTSSDSKRVAEVLGVVLDKFSPDRERTTTQDGHQEYYVNMTGGTIASTSPRASSQTTGSEHERLDMTPLSLHENEMSPPQHGTTSSTGSTNQSTPGVSDHEHALATWNIMEAVPWKKPNRGPSSHAQRPRRPKQDKNPVHKPIPSVFSQVPPPPVVAFNGQQHPMPSTSESAATLTSTGGTTVTGDNGAGAGAGAGTAAQYGPFSTLLDASNDPIDMDWATFDQFLGNFNPSGNFSFTSTPAVTPGGPSSSMNTFNRYDQMSWLAQDTAMSMDGPLQPNNHNNGMGQIPGPGRVGVLGSWGGMET